MRNVSESFMIEKKFKEIASQFGYKYVFSQTRIKSIGGSNIPIDTHELSVVHKSVTIKLIYEFGNKSLAEVHSLIEGVRAFPNFTISTKSQIKRLFSKNKSPFIVKTKHTALKTLLLDTLMASNYKEIAKNTVFEPTIKGVLEGNQYVISTSFYLGFEDKEMSILPSINLHKNLIDTIKAADFEA